MSLYPTDRDRFSRYVPQADQMVASDLTDAFEAVKAVEDELGLDPSGLFGSIHSRIFATRNVSLTSGAWRPLSWRAIATIGGAFDRGQQGFLHTWKQGAMEGRTTEFGENIPACFGALQSPLAGDRLSVPWRSFLVEANEKGCRFASLDGQNNDMGAGSLVPCTFGVLCWNLLT